MSIPKDLIINKKDLSVSMIKANLLSVYFALPVIILAAFYFLIWGSVSTLEQLSSFENKANLLWIIIAIVTGIVAHELIHGIAWMYFGGKTNGQIKFGVNWKTLTPYAHCTEPMDITAYRLGAAAPGIILGLFPYVIGLAVGHPIITLFGLFFCFAASGDALILWTLRKVEKGKQVEDHPTRAGCYVLD
jgi:hypothetical protein